jgi:hypothetical protein
MDEENNPLIQFEFHEDSVTDLRGRQSVRTTFKLSQRSIRALSILAGQLGIRQKSLFDYLINDMQTLQIIAEKVKRVDFAEVRVAKTYVISRKTLENLERISASYNAPRDALVEFSIDRILPLIRREKEKHERRKQFLTEIEAYLHQGGDMLRRAEEELGADDPVYQQILAMLRVVNNSHAVVEAFVNRGRKMETFQGREEGPG